MPTWLDVAMAASAMAQESGEWCGAPVPIQSNPLVLAPGYGNGQFDGLNGATLDMGLGDDTPKAELTDEESEAEKDMDVLTKVVKDRVVGINSWFCAKRGGTVVMFKVGGRICHYIESDYADRMAGGLGREFVGFEVSIVQYVEAEMMAQDKLRTMIPEHMWAAYMMRGMFLETSKKSGVCYVFRRGRPTVAMSGGLDGQMRILTTLCLHPLAYYQNTFCGGMVPTDEVIAHLILMRANEHFFWRKANHHHAFDWRSGL